MPILVTKLLANQKSKATKYNAALNLSLLPKIATAAGVQGNQLPNVAARVFNVESNNESVASIPTEMNAMQTQRLSLKSVEVLNKKVHAKAKRNRQALMESGSAASKCLFIYICVYLYAVLYSHYFFQYFNSSFRSKCSFQLELHVRLLPIGCQVEYQEQ